MMWERETITERVTLGHSMYYALRVCKQVNDTADLSINHLQDTTHAMMVIAYGDCVFLCFTSMMEMKIAYGTLASASYRDVLKCTVNPPSVGYLE